MEELEDLKDDTDRLDDDVKLGLENDLRHNAGFVIRVMVVVVMVILLLMFAVRFRDI